MSEMGNVKVSIIMPSYNCGEYVGNAIKSVLGQTYKDFEFIIIDDCSTDNSRDIINSFQDTRIKKIFFEKNEHMWYVHNYAINISKGNYLAEINNDDHWHPDKLKKQMEYMEMHSECGACFTLVDVVDEEDNILTEKDAFLVSLFNTRNRSRIEWIRHFYFKGNCLCHPSALIRRDVINRVGIYNYSLLQIADFDLWVRIIKHYEIFVIQEKLIDFRWFRSGRNVSAPSDEVNIRSDAEFSYVISKYFDDISDELFVEAFSEDFINKDARSHEELLCEKSLLLLKQLFCGYPGKIGGIVKLVGLLQQENTRKVLREKYNFTQKNLYELTASPILYDTTIAAKVEHFDEQQEYISQLEDGHKHQQEYIDGLERNLQSQNKYIQEVEQQKSNQQEYISQLEDGHKRQQEYIDSLERGLQSQNKKVCEVEQKNRDQQEYITRLEEEQKNQQEYICSLEKDIKDQKKYIQEIETMEMEQRTHIDNLEDTLAVQNKYASSLEELIEKYINSQHKE